jgi:hypothetical protein
VGKIRCMISVRTRTERKVSSVKPPVTEQPLKYITPR